MELTFLEGRQVLNTGHIEVGERIEAKDVDISMHSVMCILAA